MGTFFVSKTDLKTLIQNVDKDLHHLNISDTDGKNFRAMEKTCDSKVMTQLNINVTFSDANVRLSFTLKRKASEIKKTFEKRNRKYKNLQKFIPNNHFRERGCKTHRRE